jgi:hypothetical protein
MHSTTPHDEHWPPLGSGRWHRWWGYLARWLLFGLLVGAFSPVVEGSEPWWQGKLYQVLAQLLFGLACAVVFTLAENRFNTPRVQWKSWAIVVVTWLIVQVVYATGASLLA